MKNRSFGARGGYIKVTLFMRNTTQDFVCARGRYLLLTSMDRQSFGARGRYVNLASTENVLHMIYLLLAPNLTPISEMPFFSKRYNWISKCRSDTCFCQRQDVICLNDLTRHQYLILLKILDTCFWHKVLICSYKQFGMLWKQHKATVTIKCAVISCVVTSQWPFRLVLSAWRDMIKWMEKARVKWLMFMYCRDILHSRQLQSIIVNVNKGIPGEILGPVTRSF